MLKRFYKLVPLFGIICFCASLAIAQMQAQPAPKPSPAMDRLGLFVGTWTCKGALGIPPALSHPIERTIAGKKDIDDFWLFMRFEDARTKENPAPLLARMCVGLLDATIALLTGCSTVCQRIAK